MPESTLAGSASGSSVRGTSWRASVIVSISDTSKEMSIHISDRGSPRSSPSEGMRSSQGSDCIESKGTQPRSSNSEMSK